MHAMSTRVPTSGKERWKREGDATVEARLELCSVKTQPAVAGFEYGSMHDPGNYGNL